jgi:hypothetical protein
MKTKRKKLFNEMKRFAARPAQTGALLLQTLSYFCQRNFLRALSHFCKKPGDSAYSLG